MANEGMQLNTCGSLRRDVDLKWLKDALVCSASRLSAAEMNARVRGELLEEELIGAREVISENVSIRKESDVDGVVVDGDSLLKALKEGFVIAVRRRRRNYSKVKRNQYKDCIDYLSKKIVKMMGHFSGNKKNVLENALDNEIVVAKMILERRVVKKQILNVKEQIELAIRVGFLLGGISKVEGEQSERKLPREYAWQLIYDMLDGSVKAINGESAVLHREILSAYLLRGISLNGEWRSFDLRENVLSLALRRHRVISHLEMKKCAESWRFGEDLGRLELSEPIQKALDDCVKRRKNALGSEAQMYYILHTEERLLCDGVDWYKELIVYTPMRRNKMNTFFAFYLAKKKAISPYVVLCKARYLQAQQSMAAEKARIRRWQQQIATTGGTKAAITPQQPQYEAILTSIETVARTRLEETDFEYMIVELSANEINSAERLMVLDEAALATVDDERDGQNIEMMTWATGEKLSAQYLAHLDDMREQLNAVLDQVREIRAEGSPIYPADEEWDATDFSLEPQTLGFKHSNYPGTQYEQDVLRALTAKDIMLVDFSRDGFLKSTFSDEDGPVFWDYSALSDPAKAKEIAKTKGLNVIRMQG